jgi:V8-like Glu-specific endopeptidase
MDAGSRPASGGVHRHMSRIKIHLGLLLVVSALLILAAMIPDRSSAQQGDCEEEDPYGLACLFEFISAPEPPSERAQFSDQLAVVVVGRGDLVDMPDDLLNMGEGRDPGDEDPQEPPVEMTEVISQTWRVFNTGNLWEYEVIMGAKMLGEIHKEREDAGETLASDSVDDPDQLELLLSLFLPMTTSEEPATRAADGWSFGIDSRIVRTPTTSYPWRTIAQFSGTNSNQSTCTGTLIGPRHLITAAHCINSMGTNTWFTFGVAPGRDGINTLPYGESVISPNPQPGDPVRWYWTPAAWRNPAFCPSNATTAQALECTRFDIGLIVIPDRLGDQTGWMGYVARPAGALNNVAHYNRGYPSCNVNFPERPANCQMARLYGHIGSCAMGSYHHPLSNGWNRTIRNSCDLSRGHSGSAVYHYWDPPQVPGNQTFPVVAMVEVWQHCTTCGSLDFFPNRARRITPDMLTVISWLRQTFP